MALTHEQRLKAKQEAESKSIVDIAQSLGMDLVRSGRNYTWLEHDSFVLNTKKNLFYWNSRQKGGGGIQLVRLMKECSYKEAVAYLSGIEVGTFDRVASSSNVSFHYYMKEHKQMMATIDYLTKERKLSLETVNHFIQEGVLVQSTYTDKETGHSEPTIVFKHYGPDNKVKSVSLDGIWKNKAIHGKRERLKRTWGNGLYGLTMNVGTPPTKGNFTSDNPLKIIAFEAPIDLMSYYELKKESIGNAVLFCMNGFTKGAISTLLANEIGAYVKEENKEFYLDDLKKNKLSTDKFQIVLAVDNDEAGNRFVKEQFSNEACLVTTDLPPLAEGEKKSDWNEILKQTKKKEELTKGEEKQMENKSENEAIVPDQTNYMKGLQDSLEETFQQMEVKEDSTHYLTEPELKSILEEHLSKVEQLITHYSVSSDLIQEPTSQEGEQLKEGLEQTIEAVNDQTKQSLSGALSEEKNVEVTNIKERVNKLRLFVKNGFKKQILSVNKKIHRLVESIDRRFAIEDPNAKMELEQEKSIDVEEVSLTSQLVKNVQVFIQLTDEKQKLLTELQQEIQSNPLADIQSLQQQLKDIQLEIEQVEQKVEQATPTMPNKSVDDEKNQIITELATLVKEKDRLENERVALVEQPEFLRQEGSLESFRQLDEQLNNINQKVEAIEKGTVSKDLQVEGKKELDLFDSITGATIAEEVVENKPKEKVEATVETKKTEPKMDTSFAKSMEAYFDPTEIKTYLESATNFHDYTSKNIQLIMSQDANATQVASENKWKTLGYELKEHAQAIKIYQPVFSEGSDKPEFKLTPVYDVRQTTEGKLKAPLTYDLEQRESFTSVYDTLKSVSNTNIKITPLKDSNSKYVKETNTILINEGLGKEGTIKSYIHQAIPQIQSKQSTTQKEPQLQQFEREAAEYMIATHIGIDVKDIDFSIVNQLKESGVPTTEFANSVKNSTKLATSIIQSIDTNYQKSVEKNRPENRFEERISQATKDTKAVEKAYQSKEQTEEKKASIRR